MAIPKIFHHIWFQGECPEKYRENYESWKKFHPDATFMFWNEPQMLDLLGTHYKWFLPVWDSYTRMIQKIDVIKIFILHQYGGVYVDIDIKCIKNTYHLYKEADFVLSRMDIEDNKPLLIASTIGKVHLFVNNAFIASIKGHPLLMEIAKDFENRIEKKGGLQKILGSVYIMESTGPSFFSDWIVKGKDKYPRFKFLARKIVEAHKESEVTPDTCAIHYSRATWSPLMHNALSTGKWIKRNRVTTTVSLIAIVLIISGAIVFCVGNGKRKKGNMQYIENNKQ